MITITDVAKKAGVSISTVSRVLNHDKEFNVSSETIQKVNDVVEELDYKPIRKKKTPDKKKNRL